MNKHEDVDVGDGDLLPPPPDISSIMMGRSPAPSMLMGMTSSTSMGSSRSSSRASARAAHEGTTVRGRARASQNTRSTTFERTRQDDSSRSRESESTPLAAGLLTSPSIRTEVHSTNLAGNTAVLARDSPSVSSSGVTQGGISLPRPASLRQDFFAQTPTRTATEILSSGPFAPQITARGIIPPALEQILQRAFSQISGESMMSEFMRRIIENQRRGNPPASSFAMDNLEAVVLANNESCTICQDEICKGSEAVHMPCKHTFHRECLIPWLQEHNTCPMCRCEVESHCPRYNQSNFDKLKGPLQAVTVSNHANPSRMTAPPTGVNNAAIFSGLGLGGFGPQSSHVRMTIRMPFPSVSSLERLGEPSSRLSASRSDASTSTTRNSRLRAGSQSARLSRASAPPGGGRGSTAQRSGHTSEVSSSQRHGSHAGMGEGNDLASSNGVSAEGRAPKRRRLAAGGVENRGACEPVAPPAGAYRGMRRKQNNAVSAVEERGESSVGAGQQTAAVAVTDQPQEQTREQLDAPVAARTRGSKFSGSQG